MDLEAGRKLLAIDKHDLDNELIEQPQRFADISSQLAAAISERDGLKDAQKQVAAALYTQIKADMIEEGLKPTEVAVSAAVETHKKNQRAKQEYADACREVDEWQALRDAFQQRMYALRDIVQLWMAGYFVDSASKPAAPNQEASAIQRKRVTAERNRRKGGD